MDPTALVTGAVGFLVVAGWTALRWLRRGRDPVVTDDASVLLGAPPEGMTAATATIVDHQPTRLAFIAALLDLASRDEIRFRAEADTHLVGIELHGGDTDDPRVRLNRRRPIGEGEAYVLAQLKAAPAMAAMRSGSVDAANPDPAAMLAGMGTMMKFMSFAAGEQADDDSPTARAAREHGLLNAAALDPQALAASLEHSSGRALSAEQQEAFAKLGFISEAFGNPAAIAADPDAFAAKIGTVGGKPMSAEDLAGMKAWAAGAAASQVAPAPTAPVPNPSGPASASPPAAYITGEAAVHLGAPLFFGSLVETYARRHGWISGMSFVERLRWRLIGAGEFLLGLIVLAWGSVARVGAIEGLGLGVALGGFVTYLVAPAMPAVTAAGAQMRAQIAAYRRTLHMTFARLGHGPRSAHRHRGTVDADGPGSPGRPCSCLPARMVRQCRWGRAGRSCGHV